VAKHNVSGLLVGKLRVFVFSVANFLVRGPLVSVSLEASVLEASGRFFEAIVTISSAWQKHVYEITARVRARTKRKKREERIDRNKGSLRPYKVPEAQNPNKGWPITLKGYQLPRYG
jgi:hypothetical protein